MMEKVQLLKNDTRAIDLSATAKRFLIAIIFLLGQTHTRAQVRTPVDPDSIFSTYYHQRHTLFQSLPYTKGDVIFAGNSITDGGEWSELFADNRLKNRGISGDITAGVIYRLNEIAKRKPAKVFLMASLSNFFFFFFFCCSNKYKGF